MNVFTDGSCLGNPGRGGWGVWVPAMNIEKSGREPDTTNNRMELRAIIEAMSVPGNNTVYTDSAYCKNGILSWSEKWQRNGWRNSKGEEVKNRDLWEDLVNLINAAKDAGRVMDFKWVKAHGKCADNNKVDRMARAEAESLPK